MAQIEDAFHATRLTTLGRLNPIGDLRETYQRFTGKTRRFARTA